MSLKWNLVHAHNLEIRDVREPEEQKNPPNFTPSWILAVNVHMVAVWRLLFDLCG